MDYFSSGAYDNLDPLTEPKYWPIGYILGSSYSPLSLEEQFPEHKWRDAFEDLLAIESMGQPVGFRDWMGFDIQAKSLQLMRDYQAGIDEHKSTIRRLQGEKNGQWLGADARKRIERLETKIKTNLREKEQWDDLYYSFRTCDSRKMEGSAWMEVMADGGILPGWELRKPFGQEYLGGQWIRWKKLGGDPAYSNQVWVNAGVPTRLMMGGPPHLYVVEEPSYDYWECSSDKRESQEDGEAHEDPLEHDDAGEGEEDNFECGPDPSAGFVAIDGEKAEASVTSAPQEYAKPSILSQLTRTERTTSPDGTVVTKVVLKKKFSDGTEENKETVSTSRLTEP
ncbi:MAG: hypothetical protein LQ351_006573 [Letrouitia transgressa]|nr:MAG: hypothetical protein LQ351_006573 [Letrouitia transgressa]